MDLGMVIVQAAGAAKNDEDLALIRECVGTDLRGLFDPYKESYNGTSMDQKVKLIQAFVRSDTPIAILANVYAQHHYRHERPDVVRVLPEALGRIIDHMAGCQ